MPPSYEPLNIFSHRIDPRGVIAALRRVAAEVRVEGPEDDWTEATALGPRTAFRKRIRLVIGHNSTFYDRPDWPNYVAGLRHHVAGFTSVPRMAEILRVVESFRFVLSLPQFDLNVDGNDQRVSWVYEICRELGGVTFLPSRILDASGRVLIEAGGQYDPEAVLPGVPPKDDHPDAQVVDDTPPDDWQLEPPTAERVARRAAVLAAVGNRGLIELERFTIDQPDEICQVMLEWIRLSGVADEVEPNEWELLQRTTGTLPQVDAIDATWRIEGLAVLLWAMGLYELPPYDEMVVPTEVFEITGFADPEATRQIIAEAKLRPTPELVAYKNHATMAHWRFRNYALRPVPVDFVDMSKDCWIGSFDIGKFRIRDNDVLVGNATLEEADYETFASCHRTADERHLAINWLMGDSKVYSDTDTST